MMMRIAVLAALCCVYVTGLPVRFFGPKFKTPEPLVIDITSDPSPTPVPESFFPGQKLDHFDGANTQTFSQRYFIRDVRKTADAPVFLCMGGEGPPLTGYVLVASVHCNDMVELGLQLESGALLLALEHRYYGKSVPTPDFSTENMRFLDPAQAVRDGAAFLTAMLKKHDAVGAKVVTFGGSYPGMLSAYMRLRFPTLVHASVSSSSPLEASVEMPGYNQVVAQSMAAPIVGGSQQCLDLITNGHKTIGTMLSSASGRTSLASMFNICDATSLESVDNQASWAGQGVVYLPAQENDPSCTSPQCNISGICQFLLSEPSQTPVDRLAALSKVQNGGSCIDLNYPAQMKALQNTTLAGGVDRVWFYETCTRYGFYQTCDDADDPNRTRPPCPYTQGLNTVAWMEAACDVAFGIKASTIALNVADTLDAYGGWNISASRVLYPSGSIDPWHALSVLNSPNPSEPTLWVDGASHHFWTHPSLPTDSPNIVAARQAIWKQVKTWLAEE